MKNLFASILFFPTVLFAQELSRRATWEASIRYGEQQIGAVVKSVERNSPLAKVGVVAGDLILRVDNRLIDSGEDWTSATYAIRADQETNLRIRSGIEIKSLNVKLNPLPKETHTSVDLFYEQVTSDLGVTHRALVTKPKNANGKLPAMLIIGGLSCSTLENHPGRANNWVTMLNRLVEDTDMLVVRIEKTGVGDSEGDCASADFLTDLEGYRAAARMLKARPDVDASRIILYGSSMGSAIAPLIVNEFGFAGLISDGTFFKTWYEHMLEIERRILRMKGNDQSTIVKLMNEVYIPLYYGMLIQKRTYKEIVDEFPALGDFNYHSPEHMYGRPMVYYQQLQNFNLAGEWEKLQVPVRILYGTNDWIMSEYDNDIIIQVLDRAGHEDHILVKYPGLDHWNTIHETPDDSFGGKQGRWDPKMAEMVVNWAKELTK